MQRNSPPRGLLPPPRLLCTESRGPSGGSLARGPDISSLRSPRRTRGVGAAPADSRREDFSPGYKYRISKNEENHRFHEYAHCTTAPSDMQHVATWYTNALSFRQKCREFHRSPKVFHPKSREIAQNSAPLDDARPPQHSDRSPQGRPSTGTTRPMGFVAFPIAFRTENFRIFFGAANIFIRNRARSRANQPGRTAPDLRGTPAGPHKVG